ncbi:NRDE family protein [Kitasatospora sp. NPDC096128]|uniref:NRDE family protein n=1 Tax=Kitasatospora sp. NPDC096128 TaxID=3155547 RepID=UPI003326ACDA
MCTVFFRFRAGEGGSLLLGAVRDEFLDRLWKPPDHHWSGLHRTFEGGLDLTAGGTWLAVDRSQPAVAVLVNGVVVDEAESAPPPPGARSRGACPLRALAGEFPLERAESIGMGGFHLLLGRPAGVELWSWDGVDLRHQEVPPGDHVLTFYGLDDRDHERAAGVLRALNTTADAEPRPGEPAETAWAPWLGLFGDGEPADRNPHSPLVSRLLDGRPYGSTSASLVALTPAHVRYDFTADPWDRLRWYEV